MHWDSAALTMFYPCSEWRYSEAIGDGTGGDKCLASEDMQIVLILPFSLSFLPSLSPDVRVPSVH